MSITAPSALQPTLWRTCRVLANPTRLAMVRHLILHPESSVSDVSRSLKVRLSLASQYLRALNARGLLMARRQGRTVLYRAEADPSVADAEPLLRSLRRALGSETADLAAIYRDVTAFTHVRRIEICRALRNGPLTMAGVGQATRISAPPVRRHVAKLAKRGFLVCTRRTCRLRQPPSAFGRALLKRAQGTP